MKLLLDENIDIRFKNKLNDLSTFTLLDMGWAGLKNGELREKINAANFTFFITADKNLPFQQNLDKIQFVIVLLDTPTLLWEHQQQFVPKIKHIKLPNEFIKIIHISIDGFDEGKKKQQLKKVFLPEQILFI
jgi:hypothetical protein